MLWSCGVAIVLALIASKLFTDGTMALSNIRSLYGGLDLKMQDKCALVVGGTGGIGKGIALRLAKARVSVTIVGRNHVRGAQVVEEMGALSGPDATHRFIACDAMLLANVPECVRTYKEANDKLDYLVLTQGIATIQGRTETAEGLDEKLAVHVYSRMAFVDHLLPLLRRAAGTPRVLSVLSGGVHGPYAGYREDPDLRENYSIKNAADIAGFYNDLCLDSFAKENPSISFVHISPGFVNSNWGAQMPFWLRFPIRCLQPLGRSIHTCAEYLVEPLLNPATPPGFAARGDKAQEVGVTSLHKEARPFVWERVREILDQYK
ncbi:unnamed protein product [Heterosigma akashiwo]